MAKIKKKNRELTINKIISVKIASNVDTLKYFQMLVISFVNDMFYSISEKSGRKWKIYHKSDRPYVQYCV